MLAFARERMLELLVDRSGEPLGRRYSDPGLTVLLTALDSPDLFKVMAQVWTVKMQNMKSSEKKDYELMKLKFMETTTSVWPLLVSLDVPPYIPGHNSWQDERSKITADVMRTGAVQCFGHNALRHTMRPFDVSESTFPQVL